MVQALSDQDFDHLIVPVGELATIVVLAAFAGLAAALLPVRKAARVEVLTALQTS